MKTSVCVQTQQGRARLLSVSRQRASMNASSIIFKEAFISHQHVSVEGDLFGRDLRGGFELHHEAEEDQHRPAGKLKRRESKVTPNDVVGQDGKPTTRHGGQVQHTTSTHIQKRMKAFRYWRIPYFFVCFIFPVGRNDTSQIPQNTAAVPYSVEQQQQSRNRNSNSKSNSSNNNGSNDNSVDDVTLQNRTGASSQVGDDVERHPHGGHLVEGVRSTRQTDAVELQTGDE